MGWTTEQAPPDEPLAADGKYLRHSCDRDRGEADTVRDEPAQQQLSRVGLPSRLGGRPAGGSGQKDEAEGAVLRPPLERWRETGRCVVADALPTPRETVQRLRELNLAFVLTVKATSHPAAAPAGSHPVTRLTRYAQGKKTGWRREPETVDLIPSLAPSEATPDWLRQTVRQDWGAVENGVHSGRAVALGEDACRVRKGALPRVLAAFTNLALAILRVQGRTHLRRAMHPFRMRSHEALAVLPGAKPLRLP